MPRRDSAPPCPPCCACTCTEPEAGGVKLACQGALVESKQPFSSRLGSSFAGGTLMVSKNVAMAWLAKDGQPWFVLSYVGSSCWHHQSG